MTPTTTKARLAWMIVRAWRNMDWRDPAGQRTQPDWEYMADVAAHAVYGYFGDTIDGPHTLDLRYDDTTGRDRWTVQHPLACRPDLHACVVNGVVDADARDGLLPDPGRYRIVPTVTEDDGDLAPQGEWTYEAA